MMIYYVLFFITLDLIVDNIMLMFIVKHVDQMEEDFNDMKQEHEHIFNIMRKYVDVLDKIQQEDDLK